MTELQKEFEATGYTSWINADLYPNGKIYTQEYTQWLERQVLALRQPHVSGQSEQLPLGFVKWYSGMKEEKILKAYDRWIKEGGNLNI